MNTITHALLPAIVAGACERTDLGATGRKGVLSNREILLVGLAGAAPDLLDPHLSLADRYLSWSHNLFAWAGFTLLVIGIHAWRNRWIDRRLAGWLSASYLFHLFCDAIAGGITWLHPFVPDSVIGAYIIRPVLWVPLDIFCVLLTYALFRAIPRYRYFRSIQRLE